MATDSFFDISGRVILITGAASGLGLSMSEVFAERGAKLALLDNDTTPLEETHQRLRSAGASVMTLNADVRHPSQLHEA